MHPKIQDYKVFHFRILWIVSLPIQVAAVKNLRASLGELPRAERLGTATPVCGC